MLTMYALFSSAGEQPATKNGPKANTSAAESRTAE
jgi:hypothetical protein